MAVFPAGQVYVNSILVSLNARQQLRDSMKDGIFQAGTSTVRFATLTIDFVDSRAHATEESVQLDNFRGRQKANSSRVLKPVKA